MSARNRKVEKIDWSDSNDSEPEQEENLGKSIKISDRRCQYCIKLFKSSLDLCKHEKTCKISNNSNAKRVTCKDGSKKFICQICCSTYKYLNIFEIHEKKHIPPGGFFCKYCDFRCCHDVQLEKHKEEAHKEFLCRPCELTFETKELYIDHVRIHHNGRDKEYKICENCGRQFRYAEHLNYHKKTNCQTIFPFNCVECGKSFRSKGILKTHSLIHTGEKRFTCTFCPASFICKAQVIVHERKHTGEKPFKCDICGKSFAHRESLVTHSSTHTGLKPYLCECCDARFSCVSSILAHRRTRPDTCGLPQYCTKLAKACPRPRIRSKRTEEILNVRPARVIKTSEKEKLLEKRKIEKNIKITDNSKFKRHKIDKNINNQKTIINSSNKNDEEVENFDNNIKNKESKSQLLLEQNQISIFTNKRRKRRNIKIINYAENIKEEIENNLQSVEIKDKTILDNKNTFVEETTDRVNQQHTQTKENDFEIKIKVETEMMEISGEIKTEIYYEDFPVDENLEYKNNETYNRIKIDNFDSDKSLNFNDTKQNSYSNDSFLYGFSLKDNTSDCEDEQSATNESKLRDKTDNKLTKVKLNKNSNKKSICNNKNKDNFECFECIHKQQFRRKISYEQHLRNRHNKTDTEIVEILSLKNHKPSTYSCKICGKSFTYPKSLNQHIKMHGIDGNLIINCRTCSKYFATKEDLHIHAEKDHKSVITCLVCNKMYSDIGALQAHTRYAHTGREKNMIPKRKYTFVCNKCGKVLSSKNSLTAHELSKCGTEYLHKCEECGKCLSTPSALKSHMMIHSGELPFSCPFCSKGFRTKAPMIVHQRMHTGEKPFHCTYCEKTFAYRENLFIHLSTHTGIKRYMCTTCSERFSCISGLKNHWRTHSETCGADPNRTTKAIGEFVGYRKGQLEHKKKTV